MNLLAKRIIIIAACVTFPFSGFAQAYPAAPDSSTAIQQPAPKSSRPLTFSGKVTAITDGAINVVGLKGASYAIDLSSAKVLKNGAFISGSDIRIGDTISIHGALNGKTISASLIRVLLKGDVQKGVIKKSVTHHPRNKKAKTSTHKKTRTVKTKKAKR